MSIDVTTEKRFESDIEEFFLSPAGGYTHNQDAYDPQLGVYKDTLLRFVQKTQPKEWKHFLLQNKVDTERKFCLAFNNACDMDGLISVLRHGFKHRGIQFKVCYFKPESGLNQTAMSLYEKNEITCNRQWFYSNDTHNSVDMVLAVNGIPVFALELKNQYTGQNVDHAKRQWMYDRDPREICFQFNKRILGYFCIDQLEVWMTTKLEGKNTYFLPFNQGSNGAGNDGGKGNPSNPNGYPTAYFWEYVFQKDSMMDIIQKFIHLQIKEEKKQLPDGTEQVTKKKTLIFPRYHQLDVVRKLIADVREEGTGHNYLIQHSAGSGKSNSIAWTAYRLASLHDSDDMPVFSSVIVVTDRTVLDAQLQETISGFDHTIGAVETIDDKKNSKDLRDAINNGARIIVTTLQKFPVIYQEVDKVAGRNFAIIVDEAHSSQTGSSAMKLKAALADTEAALREYAEIEGKAEDEIDRNDKLVQEMLTHGKHPNLSFFAFTATPKPATLEMFGSQCTDGSFHPFHIYTNITDSWYRMDQLQIPTIYEDLFIIGLSIFALDKRVFRRKFKDCWTREISVSIPVLEYEKWKHTELQWENILEFLTGDHWHITFRKSEIIYSKIYDGINEKKQYTLCMTNSPGVYISCKRIYPETKYLKFALGFHPQDISLKETDFYDFMQLINKTNYVGEVGLDFSRQNYISRNKQCIRRLAT